MELCVEETGTTSRGELIVLSRREVDEAGPPGYAQFVSFEIPFERDAEPVMTTGGVCRFIHESERTRNSSRKSRLW